MGGQADFFLRFLDALATHLDEGDVGAAELAGRLYLSRSHFDRVIRAASGETPARFRRRILLERAAYRLTSGERDVLRIAIEAGYSSNEAFTRAFARAYGSPPTAWRASPGPVALGSPSDVHFHPPSGLRLPAERTVSAMDLMVKMIEHHVWLTGEMVDRASRLGDGELDAPLPSPAGDSPQTLRSLLSRLVGQLDMWLCAIAGRPYDWAAEEQESTNSMRSRLGRAGPAFVAETRAVAADGRLDETFVDNLCEPAEVFTYGGMIAHVLTFAAYRRTLVALALDRAGISDLGWGDPRTWVAEQS